MKEGETFGMRGGGKKTNEVREEGERGQTHDGWQGAIAGGRKVKEEG